MKTRKSFESHLQAPVEVSDDRGNLSVPPEPHGRFWEYISGGEEFNNRKGLYHALADSSAKIKSMGFSNDHRMHLEVVNGSKRISFHLNIYVEDDSREDRTYLPSIVSFVKKKNPPMGSALEGLWWKYFEHDRELDELTRI